MGEGGEGAEQYDQPGGPVAYGGAPSEPVFPCVKLRGLPFDVTDANIRDFLVSTHFGIPASHDLASNACTAFARREGSPPADTSIRNEYGMRYFKSWNRSL